MLFLTLLNLSDLHPADGYELRLDLFEKIDKQQILNFKNQYKKPIILTFKGQNIEQFYDLLSLSDFIDLEHSTSFKQQEHIFKKFPKTKIILSYHNFNETPENLEEIFEKMLSPYAYAYKLAMLSNSALDSLRLLFFKKRHKYVLLSCISMGNEGAFTRPLGPIIGNFIDYAPMDDLKTAPGQISYNDLTSIYNYKTLSPTTKIYALLGDPVDKSFVQLTHNALAQHHNLDAIFVKIRVKQEELPLFLPLAKDLFSGFCVTMPLKEIATTLVDHVEQNIGAINTISIKNGKIFGYNTDGIGAISAIKEKAKLQGKTILIIGAGGAAKGIAYEAKKEKTNIIILNRTKEKADILAKKLNAKSGSLSDIAQLKYDVLINATPSVEPIDPELICPHTIIMDIKTRALTTPFLQKATEKRCIIVYGYEMFCYQAKKQFRIWFNADIDLEFMKKKLLLHLPK